MRWCGGSRQGSGGENRDVALAVAVAEVCGVQFQCSAYQPWQSKTDTER